MPQIHPRYMLRALGSRVLPAALYLSFPSQCNASHAGREEFILKSAGENGLYIPPTIHWQLPPVIWI